MHAQLHVGVFGRCQPSRTVHNALGDLSHEFLHCFFPTSLHNTRQLTSKSRIRFNGPEIFRLTRKVTLLLLRLVDGSSEDNRSCTSRHLRIVCNAPHKRSALETDGRRTLSAPEETSQKCYERYLSTKTHSCPALSLSRRSATRLQRRKVSPRAALCLAPAKMYLEV